MKPLTEKILKSGLVDKHMAQMLEKWGNLPAGAAELVPQDDDHLKKATRDQLEKLAEEIGDEVDKARTLKEQQFDLDKLRWPTKASVYDDQEKMVCSEIPAVIDRMNRLYFRIDEIDENWFVPGFTVSRLVIDKEAKNAGLYKAVKEQIKESTTLYVGDQPVCLQVSTQKLA